MAHTPGPWEAVGNLVRSPMHQPEGLPRGVQIVECKDGYYQPFTDEAKANARLIAAAPDLLEAVKLFLEYAEQEGTDAFVRMVLYNEALSAAKAAITKAEAPE